jgi:HemY protein
MAEYYSGHSSKVISLVAKTWKNKQHPELAEIWKKLAPTLDQKNKKKYTKWFERLLLITPDNVDALMMCIEAAIQVENWNSATLYIDKVEAIQPTSELYRLKAIVQKNISVDGADVSASVRHMIERVADMQPEKCWICSETGRVYERWVALAPPHNSFNTIIWDYPQAFRFKSDYLEHSNVQLLNDVGF